MRTVSWCRRAVVAGAALALLATLASCARERHVGPTPALWLYTGSDLVKDGDAERVIALWARAAAAGYSHVVLTDPKFDRLGEMDTVYVARVERVKRAADSLGLAIVPALFPIGRSNGLLALDPHLAEALPVRGAQLEVQGGVARVVADPAVALGAAPTRRERGVSLEQGMLRVRPGERRTRAAFEVAVAPFRCYRVSVEARTRDYDGEAQVNVTGDGRALAFMRSIGFAPSQDWTRVDVVFGSLDHERVTVWLDGRRPTRGTLEWRDWRIEEVGPVNLVSRPSTPFQIAGLTAGVEFDAPRDTLLGMRPWRGQYERWHDPPVLRVRQPDGTRLRASWWFVPVLYHGQVTICPSEPATMELLADQARRVRARFGAAGYLMMHDEVRVLGWDPACRALGTPAQVMATNVRACARMLDGARVYVWGDMFDPWQNAVKDDHLVAGDMTGSWEGLDSSVTVVNWDTRRAQMALRFFARRGHRQVIAGYYDGGPAQVRGWLAASRGVPGIEGIMYTTWQGNYGDLEAFAREVKEGWGK